MNEDIDKALKEILDTIDTSLVGNGSKASIDVSSAGLYPTELQSIVGPLNVQLSSTQYLILASYLTIVGKCPSSVLSCLFVCFVCFFVCFFCFLTAINR